MTVKEKKRKVPKLRFPGFTDDWEQRKFGELVTPYTDPVPTPNDGYIRLGIRSHAKGTFHNYVRPGMELETAKMHRVGADNFIVNITFGWEHAVAITDVNDAEKLVSHRFPQFSFNEGMVPKFFKFIILDEEFRHHLWLSSPGGAGRNRVLKISEMLEYPFWVTSEDEQKKIADFLIQLDHLITLHQRKLTHLQLKKKGLLQKMFPRDGERVPELRFPGFTDDWEQRKLGEEFEKVNERNDGSFGRDHWISVAKMYFQNPEKVQSNNIDTRTYIMRKGDIAFEGHPNADFKFGRFVANDIGAGVVSELFPIYRHKQEYDNNYWKSAIQLEYIMAPIYAHSITSSGNSSNKLDSKHFLRQIIFVPKLEEQKKIGSFLANFDNLITLHQRKLDHLHLQKKALLQQMFV